MKQDKQKNVKILVVDDNPDNLGVIAGYLKDAGYHCSIASNGNMALERAERMKPGVILLDVKMPDMDGFEVCRQLKQRETTQDIPVIFLTALDEIESKKKGFDAGGVDYITKPVQREELLARMCTHLENYLYKNTLEEEIRLRTAELSAANDALQQLNQELGQRVDERTVELHHTNQALQRSLETLQMAQDQLVQAEKMAALGGLVAGVAHEINTPVGVGVTAASHLEEKTRTFKSLYQEGRMTRSDMEKYLTTALNSTGMILKNLQRAAEQVQSFKQVSVDQSSSEQRRFRLKAYINDLLFSLHPTLKRTQHTVTVLCPEDLEIHSYPGAFSQIMTNFIMNSLTHAFEDTPQGEMRLEVSREQRTLRIRYRDNGKGMTPEERSHVFEPFYTTKRGQGSTGLGLYIVYNLVTQKLKGSIECESAAGAGTTFSVQIPI